MNRMKMPRATAHCLTRMIERTDKARNHNEAREEVHRMLRSGRRFGWGRGKWADYLELRGGCVLVEDVWDPTTALIVGHGVVLTCVTEAMYRDSDNEEANNG